MAINSFDFWDTLVTRLVPQSIDVFKVVEDVTGVEGFAQKRIVAEVQSRKGVVETNLDRIYSLLPYKEDVKDLLKSTETKLELLLSSPINENINRLNRNDIVISDMYLSPHLLSDIARHNGINLDLERFYVSSAIGKSKVDGSIFPYVLSKTKISCHYGDNTYSDVKVPKRYNITSSHYVDSCIPSIIEKRLLELAVDSPSKYIIQGILRASRLNCPYSSIQKKAIWQIFSQVVGPVLYCFVERILVNAMQKGINKIFFLSRDGQVLHKIAEEICEHNKYDLICKYVYASRQALHLPGYIDIDTAESWILDDTRFISLKTIANRVEFNEDEIINIAKDYLSNVQINKNLDAEERQVLKQLIRDGRFLELLSEKSKESFINVSSYYKEVGLFLENESVAIVDVGWTGKIQKSFENLVIKSGINLSIQGYYFSLADNCVYPDASRVFGYLYSPFGIKENRWIDNFRFVIELFLNADHPSVIGFEKKKGKVGPKFHQSSIANYIEDVSIFHSAILAFTENVQKFKRVKSLEITEYEPFFIENLKWFLFTPPKSLLKGFMEYKMSEEQFTTDNSLLIKKVSSFDLLRKRKAELGLWPEGSVAVSNKKQVYLIRKLIKKIKW